MTPDRITKAFSPLLTARRDALAEANRTGRAVTVPVPGGYLTVEPEAVAVAS